MRSAPDALILRRRASLGSSTRPDATRSGPQLSSHVRDHEGGGDWEHSQGNHHSGIWPLACRIETSRHPEQAGAEGHRPSQWKSSHRTPRPASRSSRGRPPPQLPDVTPFPRAKGRRAITDTRPSSASPVHRVSSTFGSRKFSHRTPVGALSHSCKVRACNDVSASRDFSASSADRAMLQPGLNVPPRIARTSTANGRMASWRTVAGYEPQAACHC